MQQVLALASLRRVWQARILYKSVRLIFGGLCSPHQYILELCVVRVRVFRPNARRHTLGMNLVDTTCKLGETPRRTARLHHILASRLDLCLSNANQRVSAYVPRLSTPKWGR